jgi:hypothetical protein
MRLFDPIVGEARQHPNFSSLLRRCNGFNLDVLIDWARGFVDRDGKFVEEFQTTFNSSFWELYLFAVLKKYGMQVDFSKARPDFCIPSLSLNIEATIASSAQGSEPENERLGKAPPPDLNVFNQKIIIRLSNSLTAKHHKYVDSYAKLNHVKGRAYVVAVTNFDQPFSFMGCQRPIEAILYGYYVDEERYIATGGREGKLKGEELLRVFKDNGSPIELGMFTRPDYSEISAVVFSGCATMGKARALSSDPSPGIFFDRRRVATVLFVTVGMGCGCAADRGWRANKESKALDRIAKRHLIVLQVFALSRSAAGGAAVSLRRGRQKAACEAIAFLLCS